MFNVDVYVYECAVLSVRVHCQCKCACEGACV